MRRTCLLLAVAALSVWGLPALAGTQYKVVAMNGKEKVEYEVEFGGGKLFERYTAFDPTSKKFVYLNWDRGAAEPKPAATIWDHRTGEVVPLYKFPGVDHPLPVIPSMEEMKVCPLTGDKKFKSERVIAYD